ncbi:hypothetical protein JCM3766R1_004759 [Sporobolomyces carnicolor]
MATASPDPLSGFGKGWSPPQFSKDEPRRHRRADLFQPTFTEPLCRYYPPGQHPDEEKGRSIRSAQRLFSSSSLEGPLEIDSNDNSDDFFDQWHRDRSLGRGRDNEALPAVVLPTPVRTTRSEIELWSEALTRCIDHAEGRLNLDHNQLRTVPDNVAELAHIVKISAFPPRPFERNVQSTPDLFPKSSTSPRTPRTFTRSSSTLASPSSRSLASTAVPLEINLAVNELEADSLSNALFGLGNLKCLWLRQNKLARLPASIGRLSNLVDLSLSTNQLEYLPAEILRLENLATLTLHPNPFLSPPTPRSAPRSTQKPTRKTRRLLGPLVTHFTVASLREVALRTLLDTDPDNPQQRLIQREDGTWIRDHLASHDLAAFASIFPTAPLHALTSSSSSSASPSTTLFLRTRHSSATSEDASSNLVDAAPSSSSSFLSPRPVPAQPFDPFANVCRSRAHAGDERVFFTPAVERFEWVEERLLKPAATNEPEHAKPRTTTTTTTTGPPGSPGGAGNGPQGGRGASAGVRPAGSSSPPPRRVGSKTIPIKWRGCSPRCLDWLEADDDDDDDDDDGSADESSDRD